MKLTKSQLKQIIKEELETVMDEGFFGPSKDELEQVRRSIAKTRRDLRDRIGTIETKGGDSDVVAQALKGLDQLTKDMLPAAKGGKALKAFYKQYVKPRGGIKGFSSDLERRLSNAEAKADSRIAGEMDDERSARQAAAIDRASANAKAAAEREKRFGSSSGVPQSKHMSDDEVRALQRDRSWRGSGKNRFDEDKQ